MKKQEIVDYLKENKDWVLQYCGGIGGDSWWWLRSTKETSKSIKVNGNSASAASKSLIKISGDWRQTNYSAYPVDITHACKQ